MQRTMPTSKIHRATVTQADLHHVGSVTVSGLLRGAAIYPSGSHDADPSLVR